MCRDTPLALLNILFKKIIVAANGGEFLRSKTDNLIRFDAYMALDARILSLKVIQ